MKISMDVEVCFRACSSRVLRLFHIPSSRDWRGGRTRGGGCTGSRRASLGGTMPDGSQCIRCGIVIDRESTENRAQCLDTPANAKFALGSTGRCRRCDRALDKHFCNKTFCNKNPYKLRLGATSCCNCSAGIKPLNLEVPVAFALCHVQSRRLKA